MSDPTAEQAPSARDELAGQVPKLWWSPQLGLLRKHDGLWEVVTGYWMLLRDHLGLTDDREPDPVVAIELRAADPEQSAELVELRAERFASQGLYGRVFVALGLDITASWTGLVDAAAKVRAERDERQARIEKAEDALLLGGQDDRHRAQWALEALHEGQATCRPHARLLPCVKCAALQGEETP